MADVEIKVSLDAKACPICGKVDRLEITPVDRFLRCWESSKETLGKHGATISIKCWRCSLELYEHEYNGKDYNKKVAILLNVWNRMPREKEEGDDGK